jgi:hypothetical protein
MKTDAFEADLRQALARRAAEVPQATVDRLRHGNYRPRAHSPVTLAGAGLVTAAAVGAAVAVTVLAPASHQPTAQLAAWTVVKQADGNIRVAIRQLRDPAGLQSTLRADGVPASVTFSGNPNPACQSYPYGGGTGLVGKVAQFPGGPNVMVIHPSALPAGAGLRIASHFQQPNGGGFGISAGLVQASQQCTGS